MTGVWTDKNIFDLKRFVGEGKTATEVAGHMGYQFSRNAVSSKCRRLGIRLISGRTSVAIPNVHQETKAAIPPKMARMAAPRMRRITLVELRPTTCRWPLGDPKSPEFRYCGADEASLTSGRPYCPYHTGLAYETSQQRTTRQAWSIRHGFPVAGAR
jgi:GcrA cell cycle regulator